MSDFETITLWSIEMESNANMENFTIVYPSGVQSRREAVSHLDALKREWEDAGCAPVEWVESWSGPTRDWSLIKTVTLNPERTEVQNAALTRSITQPMAA